KLSVKVKQKRKHNNPHRKKTGEAMQNLKPAENQTTTHGGARRPGKIQPIKKQSVSTNLAHY
ncbi:hypothetical protein, partial [Paenarthrobacter sp. NCHU4564]|uniref:hypothetical protein n=1 Tax=Paenarthrobacter sp. NCHU4564 TaxID=3451353 RepID=UPI003F944977